MSAARWSRGAWTVKLEPDGPSLAPGRALSSGATVDFFVAVTDNDWFRFLRDLAPDEVNFWQPSGTSFKALQPGEPLLFKLHSPENFIVGGGFFARYTQLPADLTWEAFGQKNGAATFAQMQARIARYRRTPIVDPATSVGCIVLVEPFFFDDADWIPAPPDFHLNIVRGKGYDTRSPQGNALWLEVLERLGQIEHTRVERDRVVERRVRMPDEAPIYSDPTLVRRRLGEGAFRTLVTDVYGRRCAVTGEKALPALEAAHILPVTDGGRHFVENGLLLRSDVHRLFDRGYVTVTPDLRFHVSRRLRDEFANGEPYYPFDGSEIAVPREVVDRPSRDFLQWHSDTVFKG